MAPPVVDGPTGGRTYGVSLGLPVLPWASFQDGTPVTQIPTLQEGYNSFLHVFIK